MRACAGTSTSHTQTRTRTRICKCTHPPIHAHPHTTCPSGALVLLVERSEARKLKVEQEAGKTEAGITKLVLSCGDAPPAGSCRGRGAGGDGQGGVELWLDAADERMIEFARYLVCLCLCLCLRLRLRLRLCRRVCLCLCLTMWMHAPASRGGYGRVYLVCLCARQRPRRERG